MASINLGPFGDHFFNWFSKPPQPISLPNLFSLTLSQKPPFSSLSLSKKPTNNDPSNTPPEPGPGKYKQMLEQFWWECENRPDYRHSPEVEQILKEDPVFESKANPTNEEVEENEKWWEEFRESPVVKFLSRAEEIADMVNEIELKENEKPYRREDRKLWKNVPHVKGPDGRPMPRKAIKSDKESDDKFWDFARQFFFGLWGFKQRPYPPGKPIDAAQAIGYKKLEKRYYDCKSKSSPLLLLL